MLVIVCSTLMISPTTRLTTSAGSDTSKAVLRKSWPICITSVMFIFCSFHCSHSKVVFRSAKERSFAERKTTFQVITRSVMTTLPKTRPERLGHQVPAVSQHKQQNLEWRRHHHRRHHHHA